MISRIVFAGSPPAAVTVLDALVESGVEVVRVVTQPDTRRGRGGAATPTPVKARARELGIEVVENVDGLASEDAEAAVVVAYGKIIPRRILDLMPMINVHFSLLPRWRGAAPVERAILAGDTRTGVCIMAMEESLDTGPVYARADTVVDEGDTTSTLTARLARLGAKCLVDTLRRWPTAAVPQEGEATYARKISSEDCVIDWSQPADRISRQVRAVAAFTMFDGRRLKIRSVVADASASFASAPGTYLGEGRVSCGSGIVTVTTVQPEGKSEMSFEAWVNGARLSSGRRFGEEAPRP